LAVTQEGGIDPTQTRAASRKSHPEGRAVTNENVWKIRISVIGARNLAALCLNGRIYYCGAADGLGR
jgi:hypothetical protein